MILNAKKLTKVYYDPDLLVVFQDVSLELGEGESLAIVGKSGEGKSTLLHILGGLEPPTEGALWLCGETLTPSSDKLRGEKIGFVFQAYHLFERLTALENVLMPMKIMRRPEDRAKGLKLLEEVDLLAKANTPAHLLSGGEKQRVAIARAFCNDPPLLLADEPTGNLDAGTSRLVGELLFSLVKQKGKALILATHDKELAAQCDKQLTLHCGKLA